MNQLLIPVDLSADTGTALRYASQIAEPLGIERLVLLYCPPVSEKIQLPDTGPEEPLTDAQDLLKVFYHEYVEAPSVDVEFRVEPGSVIENVIAQSEKCKLMIMSSSKVGTQIRGWMGSNAFYIASAAHCPVLVLPPLIEYVHWERIWHIQQKEDELVMVQERLKQLNIDTGKITTKSFKQRTYSSLLWRLIVAYDKTLAEDIRHSILEACQQEKIDLLLLVSDRKTSFQRFLKEEVIQIILQFEIPILILQRPPSE